jgi:hypothetical protein
MRAPHAPLRLQLNAMSAQVVPVISALDQPSYMSDRIPFYTVTTRAWKMRKSHAHQLL